MFLIWPRRGVVYFDLNKLHSRSEAECIKFKTVGIGESCKSDVSSSSSTMKAWGADYVRPAGECHRISLRSPILPINISEQTMSFKTNRWIWGWKTKTTIIFSLNIERNFFFLNSTRLFSIPRYLFSIWKYYIQINFFF